MVCLTQFYDYPPPLFEQGLADKIPSSAGTGPNPLYYFVTDKGIKFLEELLECKIIESD